LALRAVAHQLGEDQAAVLDDLVARMQRLEGLMRRTLTYTKPLQLRMSVVEPRDLLEQVVKQLRPEIVKRGVSVRCESGTGALSIECDRQLLDEVLTNLLTNALEALQSGGQIVLCASRLKHARVEISIDDNGPGIPAALAATLFNPFTTSKPQGTGLGLAFCRKVIDEHGGSIQTRPSKLGGARFEIQLPALQ
jgi:signal transduction histidine kinase